MRQAIKKVKKHRASIYSMSVRQAVEPTMTMNRSRETNVIPEYLLIQSLIQTPSPGLQGIQFQGISEPEFYGDLVYKFKKIRGMTDFSDQFRKIIMRYKRIGYNLNVMRQSACLVINPITVDCYATLLNCTPVDRALDSMMAPT